MNNDTEKATAFVSRLLQNPALGGYSLLQREEQVIQFLHGNAQQLTPTLSSGQFFPGKQWQEIFTILLSELQRQTDEKLKPELEEIITKQIDYTFLQLLRPQMADTTLIHSKVLSLLDRIRENTALRRELTGPYTAISSGLLKKYLQQAFERRMYIHFELTKVQRLRLNERQVFDFLMLNILLKPATFLFTGIPPGSATHCSGLVSTQMAEKHMPALQQELKLLPEPVLKSIMHSNVSFFENQFTEATARFATVMATRSKQYVAGQQVDRGADPPDKSFFSTARRNAKFYGFDSKMLDELYKTAAENGW